MITVEIDLKGRPSCERLWARLIWQQLFNFYRAAGGDLNHMDNMLVDYPTIAGLIEEAWEQANSNLVFYWSLHNRHHTGITVNEHELDSEAYAYARITVDTYGCVATVEPNYRGLNGNS